MHENALEEFRRIVRPMVSRKEVRQEDVALRLEQLGAGSVDQSNVSRWLRKHAPRDANALNAIAALVVEIQAGLWPKPKPEENGTRPPASDSAHLLDLSALARARAIEKLADLLEKDRAILEWRAKTAWNVSEVARIEAEKAPTRAPSGVSSDQIATLERLAAALDGLDQYLKGGGEHSADTPKTPD